MIPRGTWWLIIVMILGIVRATSGQGITLDPPAEGAFVLDAAEVISPEDEQAIRDIAAAVLAETRTPIIVVTIDSMTNHWPGGPVMIETFARILFDQWRIGHATIDGEVHNRGILVVVAVNDRKARIELGAGWGRGHDGAAATIMNAILVPAFRAGTYGDGLLRAVAALGDLARGRPTGEPAVT
ncbi:MAG: TPM domain-containing protein, partial [Phycisphaerales bacterium]|nr:TPM domain-containing protein [Phycisphaerales bacterium]